MKKNRIVVIVVFILCLFATIEGVSANQEVDLFLKKDGPQAILKHIPYTMYLDEGLTLWARPKLTNEEFRQAENLTVTLQRSNLNATDKGKLGLLLAILNKEEAALQVLYDACSRGCNDSSALEALLYLSVKYGDWESLAGLEREWHNRNLPVQPLFYALGVGELKRGYLFEGENYINQAMRQGKHGPSFLALTVLNMERQGLIAAGDYIGGALEADPTETLVQYYAGLYWATMGRTSEAYKYFKNIPEPAALPDIYYLPYLHIITESSPRDAVPLWESLTPTSNYFVSYEDILINKASCLFKTADEKAALDLLGRVGEENPIAHAVMFDHFKTRDPRQAEKSLDSLGRLVGTTADFFIEKAFLQEKQGKWEEALRLWKGLKKAYPDRDEPEEGRRRIKKEKGDLWWLFKGMWLKADTILESPGSLRQLSLFDSRLYSKQTDIFIIHPQDIVGAWFSTDGIAWQWRVSPYGASRLTFPSLGAKQKIHLYGARQGLVEYYQGELIIDLDPPKGSLTLQDGGRYTNKPEITLRLIARDDISGVYAYRLREGMDAWSNWSVYTQEVSWVLAAGPDGERKIDVQYQDRAGNVSAVYTLAVVLDRVLPRLLDFKITELSAYKANVRIRSDKEVVVEASLTQRYGIGRHKYESKVYAYSHDIEFNKLNSGTDYEISLIIKDRAGNTKTLESYSFRTQRDKTPPHGGISFVGDVTDSGQNYVTLELWAEDDGGGTVYYSLSNDARNWTPWAVLRSERITWQLTPGEGEKTVYVRYRDENYNVSPTYSAKVRVDTRAPILKLEQKNVKPDQISLTWSANKEIQCTLNIKGGGLNRTVNLPKWATKHEYTFTGLKPNTTYTLVVEGLDRGGKKGKLGPLQVMTLRQAVNLADRKQGTKATASSVYRSTAIAYDALRAIDGKLNTFWQAAKTPNNSDPQWLELRWTRPQTFNNFQIYIPVLAPMTDYSLEYLAEDNKWKILVNVRNNQAKGGNIKIIKGDYFLYESSFPEVTGKAVRLIIFDGGEPRKQYLPQVLEWEVYQK